MNINKIYEAKEVLNNIIVNTPILDARNVKNNLYIKAENMQKTGSFKLRGAYYKVSSLSNEKKKNGIVAASAGNHAQGVALACFENKIKGTIVMPKSAPILKVEATKAYGVEVVLQGDTFNDAYKYAKHLAGINDASFIEPFNDIDVICGQGTIGLELLEHLEDDDTIVVPIGGGGLISGIAYTVKTLRPSIKIVGVQAKNAPSMYESIKNNELLTIPVKTMADGIAVASPGDITYDLCKKYVDEIVLVDDEEIAATILILLEKMKLVAEGAGAISVAACLFDKVKYENKIYAILSGGNIDVNYLASIIDLGLHRLNRKIELNFLVIDKPGNLKRIVDIFSSANVNINSVEHHRAKEEILTKKCQVNVVIEVTDNKQFLDLIEILKKEKYIITEKDDKFLVEEVKNG